MESNIWEERGIFKLIGKLWFVRMLAGLANVLTNRVRIFSFHKPCFQSCLMNLRNLLIKSKHMVFDKQNSIYKL